MHVHLISSTRAAHCTSVAVRETGMDYKGYCIHVQYIVDYKKEMH